MSYKESRLEGRGFSWLIAALLLVAMFINYLDRQTLSVLAPYLVKAWKMTAEEAKAWSVTYGNIQSMFLLAYALAMPLAGWTVDRLGSRIGLAFTVGIWSIIEFLHGTARNASQLGMYRFMLGIPEAGAFPAVGKVAAEHAAPHARATLIGIAMFGLGMGTTFTPLAASLVTHNDPNNWSWVFYITGIVGFGWILAWILLYRPQPCAEVVSRASEKKVPWVQLLADRRVLGLMLTRTFCDSMWWFYLYWIPPFLTEHLKKQGIDFDLHHMGVLGWIPYFFASIGSAVGGYASGHLVKRGWEPVKARKVLLWVCACIVPFTSFVVLATTEAAVLSILATATFFAQAYFSNIFSLPADIFPAEKVASVMGLNVMAGSLAGSLTIRMAGHIVQRFSYGPLFAMVAFFLPLGAICAQLLVHAELPAPQKKLQTAKV